MELLHSKLVTRRWPSKTVIEKRIRAFVSQCRLPSQAIFDGSDGNGYGSEGIGGNYPIGNALWEDTPLADENWKFPELCEPTVGGSKGAAKTTATPSPKDLLAAAVANTSELDMPPPPAAVDEAHTLGNHTNGESRGLHVHWVYDAREIVGPVKGGQSQRMSGTTATAASQSLTAQPRPRPKSASSVPSSSSTGGHPKVASTTSSSHSNIGTGMGGHGQRKSTTIGNKTETMTSPQTAVSGNVMNLTVISSPPPLLSHH